MRTCNFVCCVPTCPKDVISLDVRMCVCTVCVFFLSTGQDSGNCTEEQPTVDPIGDLGVCACVSICMCV